MVNQKELTKLYFDAVEYYNSNKKCKGKGHNNDTSCRKHNTALLKKISVDTGLNELRLMKMVGLK